MWNVLLVILIAAFIWMLNPFLHVNKDSSSGVSKKTMTQVENIENETKHQVEQARQLQKQESDGE